MIDVCICTHNPRQDVLALVLDSLSRQTANKKTFRLLIIDNASNPAINESLLESVRDAGVDVRIVSEHTPGLQRARIKAIDETCADWVLWIDDDNELSPDYIAEGLAFIQQRQDVGCFGGKLILPTELLPKAWVLPFLPYLGIKDAGDEAIICKANNWGPWEPPGAGAWTHRRVLEVYRRRASTTENFFKLGRAGKSNLASCDDSILMRGAFFIGMAAAYVPKLKLRHHLGPNRFNFFYLMRLMRAYGASHVLLESMLNGPQPVPLNYLDRKAFLKLLIWIFWTEKKKSIPYALGQLAYHLGARNEHCQQDFLPLNSEKQEELC